MAVTWNPADADVNTAISNGGLTIVGTSNAVYGTGRTNIVLPARKIYFETSMSLQSPDGGDEITQGFGTAALPLNVQVGNNVSTDNAGVLYSPGGGALRWQVRVNGGAQLNSSTPVAANGTNVLGWAIDVPNGKWWVHCDGTYIDGGNPATGTGGFTFNAASTYYLVGGGFNDGTTSWGPTLKAKAPFQFGPPSGFSAFELPSGLVGVQGMAQADY